MSVDYFNCINSTEFLDTQEMAEDRLLTIMITCPVPNLKLETHDKYYQIPKGVSLVRYPCQSPTNILKVKLRKKKCMNNFRHTNQISSKYTDLFAVFLPVF